jgi:protein TonB
VNGRAQKYRFVPLIALGLVVLLVGGGAVLLIRHFLAGAPPAQKKVAQEIHIIRPPPEEQPPPPPPPPEEKVDIPDPQQQPEPDPTPSNEPPPADLGLDADASAGSDGFGLAARKGGRDLLATGGSALSWYAGLLKNAVLDGLQDERRAHSGSYTVTVKVWVRQDGTIERIALAQSSGDKERDRAIEAALQRISRMPQAPPADMPQPVSLQIVSRG